MSSIECLVLRFQVWLRVLFVLLVNCHGASQLHHVTFCERNVCTVFTTCVPYASFLRCSHKINENRRLIYLFAAVVPMHVVSLCGTFCLCVSGFFFIVMGHPQHPSAYAMQVARCFRSFTAQLHCGLLLSLSCLAVWVAFSPPHLTAAGKAVTDFRGWFVPLLLRLFLLFPDWSSSCKGAGLAAVRVCASQKKLMLQGRIFSSDYTDRCAFLRHIERCAVQLHFRRFW